MSKLPRIIIISGPTASGKTQFALDVAQAVNGSIISADSMQVYRGLDIGTAKVTYKDMGTVPHYLLDVVRPDMPYNVAMYQEAARQAIADSIKRGYVPIVVGGTGLYIQSLVFDYIFDTIEPLDYTRYQTLSSAEIRARLALLDAKAAAKIAENNRRRLIHALALAEQTTQTKSQREASGRPHPLYDFFPLALIPPREQLYQRIDQRVVEMLTRGLVAEVDYFNTHFNLAPQIKRAIGYRETLAYLADGAQDTSRLMASIAQNTRRFAKRQLTWLRNQRIDYQLLEAKEQRVQYVKQIQAFLE